jgi:hypothetical protein
MDLVEISAVVKDLLVGTIMVLSFALTFIGYISWKRSRSPRIAMVTLAFLVIFIKGSILVLGLYITDLISVPRGFAGAFDIMLISDVIVLLLLYFALFRKKRDSR